MAVTTIGTVLLSSMQGATVGYIAGVGLTAIKMQMSLSGFDSGGLMDGADAVLAGCTAAGGVMGTAIAFSKGHPLFELSGTSHHRIECKLNSLSMILCLGTLSHSHAECQHALVIHTYLA